MSPRGFFASIIALFAAFAPTSVGWASEFVHPEYRYAMSYDDTRFDLVSPGQLNTDLIVYAKEAYHSLHPNLTVVSKPLSPGLVLKAEAEAFKALAPKLLPGSVFGAEGSLIIAGREAYLVELSYSRNDEPVTLHTILMKTAQYLMSFSLTVPTAVKESYLPELMKIVQTIRIPS